MCGSGQKAYELTDGSIITVGVKCFRHAEELSSRLAESTNKECDVHIHNVFVRQTLPVFPSVVGNLVFP